MPGTLSPDRNNENLGELGRLLNEFQDGSQKPDRGQEVTAQLGELLHKIDNELYNSSGSTNESFHAKGVEKFLQDISPGSEKAEFKKFASEFTHHFKDYSAPELIKRLGTLDQSEGSENKIKDRYEVETKDFLEKHPNLMQLLKQDKNFDALKNFIKSAPVQPKSELEKKLDAMPAGTYFSVRFDKQHSTFKVNDISVYQKVEFKNNETGKMETGYINTKMNDVEIVGGSPDDGKTLAHYFAEQCDGFCVCDQDGKLKGAYVSPSDINNPKNKKLDIKTVAKLEGAPKPQLVVSRLPETDARIAFNDTGSWPPKGAIPDQATLRQQYAKMDPYWQKVSQTFYAMIHKNPDKIADMTGENKDKYIDQIRQDLRLQGTVAESEKLQQNIAMVSKPHVVPGMKPGMHLG